MKQIHLGLNLSTKKTRKREFLEQMETVVPWAVLVQIVQIVQPYSPKAKTGRPAGRRLPSRRCFAFTTCSSGSA